MSFWLLTDKRVGEFDDLPLAAWAACMFRRCKLLGPFCLGRMPLANGGGLASFSSCVAGAAV